MWCNCFHNLKIWRLQLSQFELFSLYEFILSYYLTPFLENLWKLKYLPRNVLEEQCGTEQNSLQTDGHFYENAILWCTSNIKYTYPALFSVLQFHQRAHTITLKIMTNGSTAINLPCGCQNYTMPLQIRTRHFGVSLAQSITQAENAIYFVSTYIA